MKSSKRLTLLAAVVLGLAATTRGAEIPKQPAPATKPATQPSNRTKEQIMADINAAGTELRGIIGSREVFTDEKKRAEAAPKAIPIMKKFLAAFEELATVDPMAKSQSASVHGQFLSMMSVFGDADAEKQLAKLSEGEGNEAAEARGALILSKWWRNSTDAAAQKKLLDDARTLLKANAKNDTVAMSLMQMSQQGAATPELKEAVDKILMDEAQGPRAQMLAQQLKAESKLKSMENKPLTIAGVKNDGSQFTTADWKGKVILVDFWATWCGPCRAELPRVKKAYADFHDKGLEILGVSCDNEPDDLKKFLAENKDMPWPQLFDEKTKGWHPLATSYGINGIPTMFLIDKKGVLRSVTARENFEEAIPKMLDEK